LPENQVSGRIFGDLVEAISELNNVAAKYPKVVIPVNEAASQIVIPDKFRDLAWALTNRGT
jgi:hypothetical protein